MNFAAALAEQPDYQEALGSFRLRLERELATIPGAGPSSTRGEAIVGAAVRLVESLLGQIYRDSANRESMLARELAASRVSIETLERQLDLAMRMVSDAQEKKRPRFMRSALLAIGGFLAGVVPGVAEGSAGALTTAILEGGPQATVAEYRISCFALDHVLDESGAYEVEPSPGSPATSASGQSKPDDEEYDWQVDPWISVERSAGEYWIDGQVIPDGPMWRDSGFTPEEATDWTSVGFETTDALGWIAYRFTPTEAAEWVAQARDVGLRPMLTPWLASQWDEQGIDPVTAIAWIEAGFEVSAALPWIEEGIYPEWAVEWMEEGIDADGAAQLIAQELSPEDVRLRLDLKP